MALMKTGRKGEDPTKKKNGVEPTKAQSEVKVTANKPGEPQPKQYTWDDVSKNEEIKARNLSKRKKYESDVETYNKQMKLYNELEPKGVKKDLNTFFQGGGRYLDPTELEAWNKEAETSGISATMGGLKAKKVYVNKDYGKEGSISTLKTTTGKSYSGGSGAYHQWLGEPTKAVEQAYEKEEKIDVNRIPLPKMELKKPKIETERGEIVRPKKEEKAAPTWEEPEGGIKYRNKYKTMRTQGRGNETLLGKAKNVGAFLKSKVESIGDKNSLSSGLVKQKGKARLIQGKTGREAKEFKAYYGAPSSTSGETTYGMTAPEIAQERENLKTVKKQLRADIKKGGDVSKSELRSEIRNIRKDIRSTNKAEKYASKNIEARSVYPDGKERVIVQEKKDNQNKAYKGDDLGRQYYEYSKYQQFKKSTDNPANKNTIANQEKSLSFKEKVQQSKQNNIKRIEERKNAPTFSEKRQQRIADKQTMKRADEMVKKIK